MDAMGLEKTQELANSIAMQASTLADLNGVERWLMKLAIEQMLGAELSVHLKEEQSGEALPIVSVSRGSLNRRSGTRFKSVQSDLGKIELDGPRDRGRFPPSTPRE